MCKIPTDEKFITYWVHNGRITGGKFKQATSALRLPADWIRNVVTKLEETRSIESLIHGSSVVLPLRCTSHINGLFEQWDTVDIRVLRYPPVTTSAPIPASSNRDAIRSAKSSLSSTTTVDMSTRHGAFRNNSPSHFVGKLSTRLLGNIHTFRDA